MDNLQKAIDLIKKYASQTPRSEQDQFNAYDWSGGNYDDAFDQGMDDGYILLSQELAALLNIEIERI